MNDILADPPQIDTDKKYYEDLVGEGKRYKDPETLARSKVQADAYIKVLETRADEMREDFLKANQALKERASLEELIDQVNKRTPLQQSNNSDTNANNGNNKPAIDLEQLSTVVKQQIQALSEEDKANANVKTVVDKLKEQLGENFQAKVKQQIDEIGLSQDDFNLLARKSPNTLFRALGLEQQQQRVDYQAPPRSSERRDSFTPKGAEERTWSWWQNLRIADPASYYSGKMTVQRMEDSARLGARFEDGNYEVLGRAAPPPDAIQRRPVKQ